MPSSAVSSCNFFPLLSNKLKKLFEAENTAYYEKLRLDAYQRNQWEFGKSPLTPPDEPPPYIEVIKKDDFKKSPQSSSTKKLTHNSASSLSEFSLKNTHRPPDIQFVKYPDGTYWTNCSWKGPLPKELDDPKRGWKGLFTYIGGTIWHSPVNHKSEKPKYVKYYHYDDGHLWTNSHHKGPMPIILMEKRTEQGLTKYMADGSIWTTDAARYRTEQKTDAKRRLLEREFKGGGYYTDYMSDGTLIHGRD